MPTYVTGGPPSLQTIADLVRVFLKDWQPGRNNVPGEGIITTNDSTVSPQTLPALNSAIRWAFRKLRNVGDPRMIRDNVQVNLPVNSVTGPNIQTYLTYNGYFDGGVLNATPTLPQDLMFPLELFEQQTTSVTNLPFVRMTQCQFGLPSRNQTFALGDWEWRNQPTTNTGLTTTPGTINPPAAIAFVGSLTTVTIRMRYICSMTTFASLVAADYPNVYVPIIDCEEAVAYRAAFIISAALSGMTPGATMLQQQADEAMQDLRNSVVRRQQTVNYQRQSYDAQTGGDGGYYGTGNNLI